MRSRRRKEMLGKSIKWFWQDDLIDAKGGKSAPKPVDPLEARIQRLESELKRVIKPKEKLNTGSLAFDSYFISIEWGQATLEDRIQALEDAKKPRCKTCKKIK